MPQQSKSIDSLFADNKNESDKQLLLSHQQQQSTGYLESLAWKKCKFLFILQKQKKRWKIAQTVTKSPQQQLAQHLWLGKLVRGAPTSAQSGTADKHTYVYMNACVCVHKPTYHCSYPQAVSV